MGTCQAAAGRWVASASRQGFPPAALSQNPNIENIPKADLSRATKDCQKGEYSKGRNSFEILARIDPTRVRAASSVHGARLLNVMDQMCTP
ncbi:hypothetical protein SBA4_2680004 [Candidatus Sulfopaludibacter sp. SbA4]|nr:hypothetical protein SBA4_2680004 [Candidatus Sulfopaludibacter sp. SbA4]